MLSKFMKKQLLASTTIAGSMLVAMPALAQNAQGAAQPAADAPKDEIVVTGSRIPHPELEAASPITSVGGDDFQVTGTTRVEDLLNALPQVFAGQGGSIANGATGIATVDLRDLGASRTLVLVNGRRLLPGDPRTPVADINLIPASLIKRVDVLTGGASSVYGADAVAGVVNFQMDTDFNGFKLDGQYSFYTHDNASNYGGLRDANTARGFTYPSGGVVDGGTVDVTGAIGAGFDDGRGHVTAYFGYRKINAITQDKRDFSNCTLSGASAASVAAGGRLFNCGGSGTSAPGTFYTYSTGPFQVQGTNFIPGRTLFNFAPYNYFQRPDERYVAGFFAHYEVDDAFKPYMEFMFQDDRTVAQIAPSGDFFSTSTINCDNPLLSAQQRGIACAPGNLVGVAGVTGGTPTLFPAAGGGTYTRGYLYPGRRNVEGGGRQDDLQHTTYRAVVGATGDIARGLSYDFYYQYGQVNFAQTYRNDFSTTRLNRALDVVSVGGVPTCRSVVDGSDPNCVPYNIFQTGGVTQAALNYLQTPGLSRGQTTEQVFNGSFTVRGSEYGVVVPWATEGVGLNIGLEYRKEGLNFETDTAFSTGDLAGQGGATIGVQGGLDVIEGFVETSVPVIQDRPFFDDLRFGAGYRKSRYSVAGNGVTNSFSTDTWKVEGTWAVSRDFKIRSTFNRAVRAPNVVELFSAQSVSLDGSTDPCAGASTNAANPTAGTVNGNTFAQCALTGVTAAQFGNIAPNAANQYNGLQGGNPNLNPETAYSFTVGGVLTPRFLPGFQATVDYFNIRVKDQIGVIGADLILQQCVSGSNTALCGLINRGPGGTLWRVPAGFVQDTNLNSGRVSTSGIDITAAYNRDIGKLGHIGFTLTGTYLVKYVVSPVGVTPYECAGKFGANCGTPLPEWRHRARLTYTIPAGVSMAWTWRYFAATNTDGSTTAPGNLRLGAQSYFDLAFTVPVGDKFTLQAGANNLFDRDPPLNGQGLPVFENGNTFPQVYDALGRYVYVGVTLNL